MFICVCLSHDSVYIGCVCDQRSTHIGHNICWKSIHNSMLMAIEYKLRCMNFRGKQQQKKRARENIRGKRKPNREKDHLVVTLGESLWLCDGNSHRIRNNTHTETSMQKHFFLFEKWQNINNAGIWRRVSICVNNMKAKTKEKKLHWNSYLYLYFSFMLLLPQHEAFHRLRAFSLFSVKFRFMQQLFTFRGLPSFHIVFHFK